jgi:hypothetical protein
MFFGSKYACVVGAFFGTDAVNSEIVHWVNLPKMLRSKDLLHGKIQKT